MLDNFLQNQLLPCDMRQKLIDKSIYAFKVKNGNIPKWALALNEIKTQTRGVMSFKHPYLYIDTEVKNQQALEQSLKKFTPWRKGPYQIGKLKLESEWRGDKKWDRLYKNINVKNKKVLDIGCGNGYFTYLLALSEAKIALGIEPFLLFNYQFQAINSLINHPTNAFVLPLKLEQMPQYKVFDVIFSMGVLYHQKEPLKHLKYIKTLMQDDAQLVLETLIIDEKYGNYIAPKDRYARMRNVWCLPSLNTLKNWLISTGFNNIEVININQTNQEEQRATHWIGNNTKSLKDFLDNNDKNFTIEGLPAPKRAILICNKV